MNKFKNILAALVVALAFAGSFSIASPSPAAAHHEFGNAEGIFNLPGSNRSYIPWTEFTVWHNHIPWPLNESGSFDYAYANSTQGAPGSQYRVWLGCVDWQEFVGAGGDGVGYYDVHWGYTTFRDQVANGHDPWEPGYGTALACPPGMAIIRNCGSIMSAQLCPGINGTPGLLNPLGEPYSFGVLVENSPW